MSPAQQVRVEFVEFIPETLEPGIIYVSRRYATASHLCCCGCGLETVTPLNAAKWNLSEHDGLVSLWPSVGNWNFPCKAHYIIQRGRVVWASKFSPGMIAEVKSLDRRDAELHARRQSDPLYGLKENVAAAWRAFVRWLGG